MPIPAGDDDFIILTEASKLVPGRPHVNTLRRWCVRGYGGVILRSWRCGSRRLTTLAAIHDFIAATSASDETCSPLPAGHAAAEAQLDSLGV